MNAIDKDDFLNRLRAERRKYASQGGRMYLSETLARYDFAIFAVESEPSVETALISGQSNAADLDSSEGGDA